MTLTLHSHPLSTFCQKAKIGLFALEVPFTENVIDLGHPEQRAALLAIWKIGKFPVLEDKATGRTVPETSILLEHAQHAYAKGKRLIPETFEEALATRAWDRFFDWYVNVPLGKIVMDTLRPEGQRDPLGVQQARELLATAYDLADAQVKGNRFVIGDTFTLADCAAAPTLFFARRVQSMEAHPHLTAYFARVSQHPAVARSFAEAAPYLALFPGRPTED